MYDDKSDVMLTRPATIYTSGPQPPGRGPFGTGTQRKNKYVILFPLYWRSYLESCFILKNRFSFNNIRMFLLARSEPVNQKSTFLCNKQETFVLILFWCHKNVRSTSEKRTLPVRCFSSFESHKRSCFLTQTVQMHQCYIEAASGPAASSFE